MDREVAFGGRSLLVLLLPVLAFSCHILHDASSVGVGVGVGVATTVSTNTPPLNPIVSVSSSPSKSNAAGHELKISSGASLSLEEEFRVHLQLLSHECEAVIARELQNVEQDGLFRRRGFRKRQHQQSDDHDHDNNYVNYLHSQNDKQRDDCCDGEADERMPQELLDLDYTGRSIPKRRILAVSGEEKAEGDGFSIQDAAEADEAFMDTTGTGTTSNREDQQTFDTVDFQSYSQDEKESQERTRTSVHKEVELLKNHQDIQEEQARAAAKTSTKTVRKDMFIIGDTDEEDEHVLARLLIEDTDDDSPKHFAFGVEILRNEPMSAFREPSHPSRTRSVKKRKKKKRIAKATTLHRKATPTQHKQNETETVPATNFVPTLTTVDDNNSDENAVESFGSSTSLPTAVDDCMATKILRSCLKSILFTIGLAMILMAATVLTKQVLQIVGELSSSFQRPG